MLRKKIIGLLLLATGWTACTQNFDEINTDPNRLEKIDPSTLMTPTLYDLANFNYNRAHSFTHHLMQFMVTTRNRTLSPSSCISLLFRNGKRVISSYCSTVGLLRFAHRCSG